MVLIPIATIIRLAQRHKQCAFLLDSIKIKAVSFSDAWSGSVNFKSIVPHSMDTECLDVVLHGDLPTGRVYDGYTALRGRPLQIEDAVLWGSCGSFCSPPRMLKARDCGGH